MNGLRIGFLGTRATNFESTATFFHDVLGLKGGLVESGWSWVKLPSGSRDTVEVFGPEKQDARLIPDSAGRTRVAFIVDDIVSARAELATAGIELLSDIDWWAEISGNPPDKGFGWFFLRKPDGNVYDDL